MGPVEVARRVFGSRPLHVAEFEPVQASYAVPQTTLRPSLATKLREIGAEKLYQHQAQAYDQAMAGHDIMVVTGTSSGKSLCYNLPVVETCLSEPVARALYLFPTKALAQDQAGKLQTFLPDGLFCGTYDGDTSTATRAMVRKTAHIVMTNPDMLHVGILPHHEPWVKFLKSLSFVVIDEAHTYRGVFGSHVAGIMRRLIRLCEWHNNRPQVIACSATIANPLELVRNLTGRTAKLIDHDTAPRGHKTVVLVEPPEDIESYSANADVASLLAEFAENSVRTLAFCKSRVSTELVVRTAKSQLEKRGSDPGWIDSYRGGYKPKERRDIEQALFKGKLRGLATTNAMELGVDVGGLDAVLMNGYPGSVSSFWQQAGRAGRGQRAGLAVMLAQADPLEQYLVRQPHLLLDKPVECATLDPDNPFVLEAQLRCACYERAIGRDELIDFGENASDVADQLVESGTAAWQGDRLYFRSHDSPAKKVNIRGIGSESVVLMVNGEPLGEMELWRAYRQAHEGAVYLHRGQTFLVTRLDMQRLTAELIEAEPHYYTRANVHSLVESNLVLEQEEQSSLHGVKVTTSVPSFGLYDIKGGQFLGEESLDLPVTSFDTLGVRIDFPDLTGEDVPVVHALEHALTGVAPLIAGCDRNDLGSCWYVMSPDTMAPAITVFDSAPGGVGLSESLFKNRELWWANALALLTTCSCEEGCPSCLLSSRCECGNENLDKQGAVAYMRQEPLST